MMLLFDDAVTSVAKARQQAFRVGLRDVLRSKKRRDDVAAKTHFNQSA